MTKGSCLCSAIEYQYTGEPMFTALCHCTNCQKWSGSAYSSNVGVQRKDFQIIKGSPKNCKIKGDSGNMNDHRFCGECGSSLWTEPVVMPDVVCIKVGGIDDKAVRDFKKTEIEVYCKDRMAYSKPIEGAEQKPGYV